MEGGLGRTARFAGLIRRHWPGLFGTFVIALFATQIYGIVGGHRDVPLALLLTVYLVNGPAAFRNPPAGLDPTAGHAARRLGKAVPIASVIGVVNIHNHGYCT